MKNLLNLRTYLVLITALFLYSASNAQYLKRRTEKLPELMYYTMDAELFTNNNLPQSSGLILLYINPSCQECHKELKQLLDNMEYLKKIEILIISPTDKDELEAFAKQYELAKYPQITVLHDPKDFFYRQFKLAGYPSLYVYNSKKELINEFNSFADFSEIADGLPLAGK
jgi:peroxiredoxin